MAHIIRVVCCFAAALQAAAERIPGGHRNGARRDGSGNEAALAGTEDYNGNPTAFGNDIDEFVANLERRLLQLEEENDSVAEGHSSKGSLVEINGSAHGVPKPKRKQCAPPEKAFPGTFVTGWFSGIPKLGSGAFGSAYKVEFKSRSCHGTYVLKSTKNDEDGLLEAQLGESIEPGQPGLVPTFAHAVRTLPDHEECMFMLMEHADSGELKSMLAGKLSPRSKIRIFHETLQGLYALHKRGIVHRDIKPENVFLAFEKKGQSYRYHPLVGDFGLACCSNDDATECPLQPKDTKLPKCSGVGGTLGYISPMMMNRTEARPEDDLWAMGKLLLHMLRDNHHPQFTDDEWRMVLTEDEQKLGMTWTVHPFGRGRRTYLKRLAKLVGKNMMSDEMAHDLELREGDPLLNLLNFLLCSGCRDGYSNYAGAGATLHAMRLTKDWMKDEDVQLENIEFKRPSRSDVEKCLGHDSFFQTPAP